MTNANVSSQIRYNRFLLLVAGLGGLLFGIDVSIISGAMPYLQASSDFSQSQLSFVAAAVLLGAMISTVFTGTLADLFGRKTVMILSGLLFVVSVPVIALSHSYNALIFGRLLQGVSGGLIGVVAPLYLAECLAASSRGRGTAVFQWLLTLGFVAAAVIGYYFSGRVEQVAKLGDPNKLKAFKDAAWRGIFWVSLPPGILFVIGSFLVSESPRWLFRRGKKDAALRALLRSRTEEQAKIELQEMHDVAHEERSRSAAGPARRDSLLQRKYLLPFALACIILACNQATGINSIIIYNTTILIQAGLSDKEAHLGYVFFTIVNFLMTIVAIALVDRKGRKFLLMLGTAGVMLSLLTVGFIFKQSEAGRTDHRDFVQSMVVQSNQTVSVNLQFDNTRRALIGTNSAPATFILIYSYGGFYADTKVVRSDEPDASISIDRSKCVPDTAVAAFFKNPFADLAAARTAPLKIEHALVTPVPTTRNGWLTAILIYCFTSAFAIGPGVCVWLALSELMPTRIRSNGMSLAMLFNKIVSTTIAALFLPAVGQHGYSTMFFIFSACTIIYFLTAAFLLPETKGKTLEEIEAHFEGKR